MCAATALGIYTHRRSPLSMSIPVLVKAPQGWVKAYALIDSGAEANFVNQRWVKEYDLPNTGDHSREVKAIDGHYVRSYSHRELEVRVMDSESAIREHPHAFEAVDIQGYDLILGYPWLMVVNPNIDWAARTWTYRTKEVPVEIMSAEDCMSAVLGGCAAHIIMPRRIAEGETMALFGATAEEPTRLPAYLEDFADVFSEEKAAVLQDLEQAQHAIELEPGKQPPFKPMYGLSERELAVLREYLESSLEKGWIRPSKSPAGAPILFAPKKDGSLRLCVDYRGLNLITLKNRYPLPLIGETLDRLSGASIYTQLDLRDAYHRIRIKKGDEWKTAFRTRYGHYEYQVLPFGLTNAPATFQAYINKALSGFLDTFVVVYLDDILIYSRSEKEHRRHVRLVLERLRKYRLYVKLSKCAFDVETVNFLGFVISPKGVEMEKSRILAISSWPEPTCVRDIQVFLGFSNFYRRFIEGYSRVAAPLTNLTKGARKGKEQPAFVFNEAAREAFQELKEHFTSAPMLVHHDPSRRIRIEPDASGFAIAAILSELCDDGLWHPVAYMSRKMLDAETRYEIHDGEMLAIYAAFQEWRRYLEGSRYPIVVLSDHANLRYFMTTKALTRRQARWAEMLAVYDFVIEHRPGKSNPADAPSRRPDYAQGFTDRTMLPVLQEKLRRGAIKAGEWTNVPPEASPVVAAVLAQREEQWAPAVDTCLPHGPVSDVDMDESNTDGDTGILDTLVPRLLVNAAMETETAYSEMPETMAQLLLRLQLSDAEASKQCGKLASVPQGSEAECSPWSRSEDGLLRYEGKAYVPKDPAVVHEIMRVNHDDPQGGHFGVKRTLELVRHKYYWHGMAQDVAAYIETCDACQRTAVHRHKEYGMLEPLPQPSKPLETITMDFITGLPPSKWRGKVYDAALVIVEAFTKFALYIPCRKDIDAPELAELMLERVIAIFGIPKNLVSDRGSLFTSKYWSSLCHYIGAKRRLSTAFHPQTDGQTERQNQTLEHYLRVYINYRQDDWARWLPMAQLVYNNSVHSSTKMAPMEALTGVRADLRLNVDEEISVGKALHAQERVKMMEEQRLRLSETLAAARDAQKQQYDKKHKPMSFKIGDEVMLRAKNIRLLRPSRKLDHRQLGPFPIIDAWGKQAYKLRLTPQYRAIHPVFHVSLLEPYHRREGEPERQGPILVDGEEEWVVEKILTHRRQRRKLEYLVRWEGYTPADDTWEPEAHLKGSPETLEAYKKKHSL